MKSYCPIFRCSDRKLSISYDISVMQWIMSCQNGVTTRYNILECLCNIVGSICVNSTLCYQNDVHFEGNESQFNGSYDKQNFESS